MAWRVEFSKGAQKDLAKLGGGRERILRFLAERIENCDDPRRFGEALKGPVLGRFWKYRVGDYRLVCHLQDDVLLVLVVRIGDRKEVYR